jgi:hypothetical protein
VTKEVSVAERLATASLYAAKITGVKNAFTSVSATQCSVAKLYGTQARFGVMTATTVSVADMLYAAECSALQLKTQGLAVTSTAAINELGAMSIARYYGNSTAVQNTFVAFTSTSTGGVAYPAADGRNITAVRRPITHRLSGGGVDTTTVVCSLAAGESGDNAPAKWRVEYDILVSVASQVGLKLFVHHNAAATASCWSYSAVHVSVVTQVGSAEPSSLSLPITSYIQGLATMTKSPVTGWFEISTPKSTSGILSGEGKSRYKASNAIEYMSKTDIEFSLDEANLDADFVGFTFGLWGNGTFADYNINVYSIIDASIN